MPGAAVYPLGMDSVHLEVTRFLREHGIARGERVLLAVSGGADSVALLYALLAIGQRVGVGHVDHGLRGAAAREDLAFVRNLAAALGVPFGAERVQAGERDHRSPEARARELRYAALEGIRLSQGCSWIATAHSLDDQAETVLLRAVRGTGLAGLAGIAPRLEDARILRPLLAVRRASLREYLRCRGLCWREDRTNADTSIPRNRLRASILPALEEVHAGAACKLADLARIAREHATEEQGAVELALDRATESADGGLWIEPDELGALEPSARHRALLLLLAKVGLGDRATMGHVRRIDAFLWAERGTNSLSLPKGRTLVRDGARFWLGELPGPRFPLPVNALLGPPGALEFPEREIRLRWRHGDHAGAGNALLLPARPTPLLRVRSPGPGDRIRIPGRRGEKRLTDLFASARWSRSERARALVVEGDGRVLWVPGLTTPPPLAGSASKGWQLIFERLSSQPQS